MTSTQASAETAPTSAQTADDSFTLYDLRVEAVCPPGQRILCGAKEGDYFTLECEMMYLPPRQGISIYSLGKNLSTPSHVSVVIFSYHAVPLITL